MTRTLIFLLLLNVFAAEAQETLVPWKKGGKYGLATSEGKIVVDPAFERLDYLGGEFFMYFNPEVWKDSTRYKQDNAYRINEVDGVNSGVFFRDKPIIKNRHHNYYTLIPHKLIIGSEELFYERLNMLYNLSGKALFNEIPSGTRIIDTAGSSLNHHGFSKYLVILFYHNERDLPSSVYIYDIDKQEITETLLRRSKDFNYHPHAGISGNLYVDYSDSLKNKFTGFIKFNAKLNKYQLQPQAKGQIVEITDSYEEIMETVVAIDLPADEGAYQRPNENKQFRLLNDTLRYRNKPAGRKNAQYYFINPAWKQQEYPLIFKLSNKYGILINDSLSVEPDYDSLKYLRNQEAEIMIRSRYLFLACKKDPSGVMRYGILDGSGKAVIPVIYDTLLIETPELRYVERKDKTGNFTMRKQFGGQETQRPQEIKSTFFIAYKNKRAGVISIKGDELVPFEYDSIWNNGTRIKWKMPSYDFFILKKNDLYGVFEVKKNKVTTLIEPVFPKVPVYCFKDYWGIKGFTLFNLADEESIRAGFAGSDGKLYWE